MPEQSSRLKGLRLSNEEMNRLTRKSLETALLQLLQEQDIRDISIEALVQRAGVSCMAYYRNFGSKEAILDNCITRVCDKIAAVMGPCGATTGRAHGAKFSVSCTNTRISAACSSPRTRASGCKTFSTPSRLSTPMITLTASATGCISGPAQRITSCTSGCARGCPSRRTRWPITATRPPHPSGTAKRGSPTAPSPSGITPHWPRKTISFCGRKSHRPRKNTPCAEHRGCSLWLGFPSALRA